MLERKESEETRCYTELFDKPNMYQIVSDLFHDLGMGERLALKIAEKVKQSKEHVLREGKNSKIKLTDQGSKSLLTSTLFNQPTPLLTEMFSFEDQEIKTTAALARTCKSFTPFFQPGLAKIKKKIFSEVVKELTLELLQKLSSSVVNGEEKDVEKSLVIIGQTDSALSKILIKGLLGDDANVAEVVDFAGQIMKGRLCTLSELAKVTGFMSDDYIKLSEVKDDTYCGFKRGFLLGKRF